ncbi:MAG: hypothetical protein MRZ79_11670 [Bacteroidia bacterium]|nr:hypothetical protein [Bacteroidia bacterium]
MYQKVEEYIRDHREQLDVETPPDQLWNKINHSLEKKTRPLWSANTLWKIAAAIIIITLTSALFFNFQDSFSNTMDSSVADLPKVELPASKADWRKAEKEYQAQINGLLAEIQAYPIEEDFEAQKILIEVSQINLQLDKVKEKMMPFRYDSARARQVLSLYEAKVQNLTKLRDHLKNR